MRRLLSLIFISSLSVLSYPDTAHCFWFCCCYADEDTLDEVRYDQITRVTRLAADKLSAAEVTDKSAVVFDIYGTAIEESTLSIGRYVRIQPVFRLYQFAKERGFKIIFLTASTDRYLESTLQDLAQLGYEQYENVIAMPDEYQSNSMELTPSELRRLAADWKEAQRVKLSGKYDIVATIDNHIENLRGKNVGHPILIPGASGFTGYY